MQAESSAASFDYDSIPPGYYDEVFHRRRGAQSKWHHLKFARVRREIPARCRLLDVACGPGTLIGTLGADVDATGVDLAAPQIEFARRRYGAPGKTFVLSRATGELPADNDSVDVITMVELLEHLEMDEIQRLLRECRRVLRPGGKLIVTTPNYAALWPLLEWLLNRVGQLSYSNQHITKFTGPRLRETLAAAALTVEKISSLLLAAPFAAALSWSLADGLDRLESALTDRSRVGHLLLGVARKP
jgi:2-polyprenyl-3-methyl-5-hydroxy-6-metoxy-1,4-benzoquinol methylase